MKKLVGLSLIAFLALVIGMFGWAGTGNAASTLKTAAGSQAEGHNNEGMKEFSSGNWAEAQAHFKEAVKADPKARNALSSLGAISARALKELQSDSIENLPEHMAQAQNQSQVVVDQNDPPLCQEYSPNPAIYDEMCLPDGNTRAHWAYLTEVLKSLGTDGLKNRRREARRWFGRRVIARGAGRPRVLLGRDVSPGGMRVENAQGLVKDDALQIALHSHTGEVPLVVTARVLRVDDNGDAALRFVNLGPRQVDALAKLMGELGAGDEVPLVSELLDPAS